MPTEKRMEYMKEYQQRPDVKEKRNKQKYQKVKCECGGCYTMSMRSRHYRTGLHIQWVEEENEKRVNIEPLLKTG